MGEVIKFPLSAYKLSPEEEQRLAEASAFPSAFVDLCKGEEMTVIRQEWYESLKKKVMVLHDLKMELKRMTLWDRIFNWPYKEKDDD